jgi:hypothetical protein
MNYTLTHSYMELISNQNEKIQKPNIQTTVYAVLCYICSVKFKDLYHWHNFIS